MKSVRQKRIEEDNNKEWAQIQFKQRKEVVSNYFSFKNQEPSGYGWWSTPDEIPTFYSYFNRGDTLTTYYYDKASLDPKATFGNLDSFYIYYTCKNYAMNWLSTVPLTSPIDSHDLLVIAHIMAFQMTNSILNACIYFQGSAPYRMVEFITKNRTNAVVRNWLKQRYIDRIKALKDVNEKLMLHDAQGYVNAIFQENGIWAYEDTGRQVAEVWNEFVDKSTEYLNKINTEGYYDADDVWHWKYSACWVKFTVNLTDEVTYMSSQMKLYKQHQLKRGRYISQAMLTRSAYKSSLNIGIDSKLIEE